MGNNRKGGSVTASGGMPREQVVCRERPWGQFRRPVEPEIPVRAPWRDGE